MKSRQEALDWAMRIPAPQGEESVGEVEIRQLFELDDFEPSQSIDKAREIEKNLKARQ